MRENLKSNIKLQTIRELPLFYEGLEAYARERRRLASLQMFDLIMGLPLRRECIPRRWSRWRCLEPKGVEAGSLAGRFR